MNTLLLYISYMVLDAAMDELTKNGGADFLLLKNPKLNQYWQSVLKERKRVADEEARVAKEEALRKSALSKLSKAERKVLGLE